jgi:hypothetical protein
MILTLHTQDGAGVILRDEAANAAYDELMICLTHPSSPTMTHLGQKVVAFQIDGGKLRKLEPSQ